MTDTYSHTRSQLEEFFDRTAAETWARLTSDAPVSKIRQTVRAGRDRMRMALLYRLPQSLHGKRVLDAGCGAGQMSVELAARGAEVVAVDISPNLLDVARKRTPAELADQIVYRAGDMLDPDLGQFDHVVAMDSLIHYAPADIVTALAALAHNTRETIQFTIAPWTPMLGTMHAVGKLFPRNDKSPAIRPVAEGRLRRDCASDMTLRSWSLPPGERIKSGFYISQAMRLTR